MPGASRARLPIECVARWLRKTPSTFIGMKIAECEHGGDGADADRQRQDRDQRESQMADEDPPPEAKIRQKVVNDHVRAIGPKSTLPARREFGKNAAMLRRR
jgi:hypothetical protein